MLFGVFLCKNSLDSAMVSLINRFRLLFTMCTKSHKIVVITNHKQ